MTFLRETRRPGRPPAKRSWICGPSKSAKVRGSRGRSKSAKVSSTPYPKDPRVTIPKRSKCLIRWKNSKGLCVALAQRGEAGSASREQSCCSWCVELALPHLTACAAAAVLSAVLARAESFTLVVAGHELELSDGCSCSTSSCPTCCTTARLEGQQ